MSEEYIANDPREESCSVLSQDTGEAVTSHLSRANAEILSDVDPFDVEYISKCKPVGVVDAIEAPPIAPRDINSFAPSAGTRGI